MWGFARLEKKFPYKFGGKGTWEKEVLTSSFTLSPVSKDLEYTQSEPTGVIHAPAEHSSNLLRSLKYDAS